MNVPDRPDAQLNDDGYRTGRQFTIVELFGWFFAVSLILGLTTMWRIPLLPVVFYGTLGSLTWRLSKAMPIRFAILIAFAIALGLTVCCFAWSPPGR